MSTPPRAGVWIHHTNSVLLNTITTQGSRRKRAKQINADGEFVESSSNPPVLLAALPLLHGGWRTTPSTPHPLKMVQRACKSSREGLLAASLVPFWHARTKTLLQEAAKPGDNASTWPSASGSGSPPTLIETNQRVCGPRLASAMRCNASARLRPRRKD
jgi:hypothetical protein